MGDTHLRAGGNIIPASRSRSSRIADEGSGAAPVTTRNGASASVKDASIYAVSPFDRLTPLTSAYATLPVLEGFNWREILAGVDAGRWYLIVFRSLRTEDPDEDVLTSHDDMAFAEALASGGLLRYYRGEMDAGRNCLSLCVWRYRRQAREATLRVDHQAAAGLTHRFYVWYDVERYMMTKRKGSPDPVLRSVGGYRHRPYESYSAGSGSAISPPPGGAEHDPSARSSADERTRRADAATGPGPGDSSPGGYQAPGMRRQRTLSRYSA